MAAAADVIIVGGGPAGLAAALALRKKGLSVLVADGQRPPIDKACGEGLMPDAVEVLSSLGVQVTGEPFAGIRFLHPEAVAEARLSGAPGLGVRRTLLHEFMRDAAERAGVTILWETPATGLTDSGVMLAGEPVHCRWLIGADGAQSLVRQWSGLDRPSYLRQRYGFRSHFAVQPWSDCVEVYWARDFQVYITPVAHDQVLAAVLCSTPELRVMDAIRAFPELAARLRNAAMISADRGAISARAKYWAVTQGSMALVGDAAGTVDAITGEGLGLAFHQAIALAAAIAENRLDGYDIAHRRIMRKTAFMGRMLTLLDGRPERQRRAIGLLARHPFLFSTLLQFHVSRGVIPKLRFQAVAQ